MTELFMRRTLSGLEPADGAEMPKIKVGQVVKVKVTQPRNIKHHRKFFALCNLVFSNQETYETLDDLVYALKIAAGHRKAYPKEDGTMFYVPRSIAFHNMDQTEFDQFYAKIIKLIVSKVIPGLDEGALRAEIESMVA